MSQQLQESRQQYIYILELKGNCFYVGRTQDISRRLADHKNNKGKGAQWTAMHGIKRLLAVIECFFREEEDMWIKKLMAHYSIHQVRGGAYSQTRLGYDQVFFLEREIRNSQDTCFVCGQNHFVSECSHRPKNEEQKIAFLKEFNERHENGMRDFGKVKISDKEKDAQWKAFKDTHLQGMPCYHNQYGCQTFEYPEAVRQQRKSFSMDYLGRSNGNEQMSLYIGSMNSAFLLALAEALFLRPEVRVIAKRTLLEIQSGQAKEGITADGSSPLLPNRRKISEKKRKMDVDDDDYNEQMELCKKMSEAKKKIKRQQDQKDRSSGASNSVYSWASKSWGKLKSFFSS